MSTHSVLECNGLHTNANPLSAVPRGALKTADNVVVRAKDLVEPRRGQNPLSYTLGSNAYERPDELDFFNGTALVAYDGRFLAYDTGSAFSTYAGPIEPPAPDELRMKFATANEKCFFTTSLGIKMLESVSGTPKTPGLARPFNVETKTVLTDTGDATQNWMDTDNQVAVRVCFARRDDRNNVQLGAVSERAVLTNSTGAGRAITVHIGLPSDIAAGDLYRIWMTELSGGDDITPDDECWLVYEGTITAANVTAGLLTKVLTNTESVLSDVALYTNPNTGAGLGISGTKLQAPWAKDICYWNSSLWAFGTKGKQRFTFTLLGIDSGGGAGTGIYPSENPTLTINGKTYEFNETGTSGDLDAGTGHYNVNVSSFETDTSAKELVIAINAADADVRAYYVARADGWPGEIVVEETGVGGDAFTVYADGNSYTAFSPELPQSSGDALSSTCDDYGHWVRYTPIDEPEAWPPGNVFSVGKRGARILRGVPLKDGLFCWMDDGTIQVIRGKGGNFRVDTLDSTASLVGPDTACVLNNQIWALTDQGAVSVSEAGVGMVGLPIEVDIASLFGGALETTKLRSFGFAYETERIYCLALPQRAGQQHASVVYVFNYVTKAWTRWPIARNCGRVNPVTKVLYMGHATQNKIWKERKTLSANDLADETLDVTISSATGSTVTLSSTTGIAAGDVLEQGDVRAVVSSVTGSTVLAVSFDASAETVDFAAGAATIYKAFECDVEWVTTALGSPGLSKNISDFTLHFIWLACQKAEAFLSTDLSFAWARTKQIQRDGFGSMEWGAPWGDPAGLYNERMGAPGQKHSASFVSPRFVIREAFAQWKLAGYSLEHELVGERTKR